MIHLQQGYGVEELASRFLLNIMAERPPTPQQPPPNLLGPGTTTGNTNIKPKYINFNNLRLIID